MGTRPHALVWYCLRPLPCHSSRAAGVRAAAVRPTKPNSVPSGSSLNAHSAARGQASGKQLSTLGRIHTTAQYSGSLVLVTLRTRQANGTSHCTRVPVSPPPSRPFLARFLLPGGTTFRTLASYLCSASWRLHLCYRVLCWHRWDSSR